MNCHKSAGVSTIFCCLVWQNKFIRVKKPFRIIRARFCDAAKVSPAAEKLASERGVPQRLKKALGLGAAKRIRLR